MANGTTHDVVYLFSMSNNVWAFDAASGAPLWPHPVSLGKPFLPAWNDPVDSYHIDRSFGVLSTPVIDRETATAYAVSWIVDAQATASSSSTRFAWRTASRRPARRRRFRSRGP